MKKYVALCAAIVFCASFSCKRQQAEQPQETVLAKKYAKYRLAVRKEAELKTWAATLEKGEDVELLQEQDIPDKAGKKTAIAKVRLADGTEGFVESRHLADKVIVFTEETPVFVRPTMGSKLHCKVPRGTIAFVVGEQANWAKVYAGKLGDVWLTEQWVQGGYSTDPKLILSARAFETCIEQLSSTKEDERKAAKQKLAELSQGEDFFAALAREKLAALESQPSENEGKEAAQEQ
jgi:lipoprotein LenA